MRQAEMNHSWTHLFSYQLYIQEIRYLLGTFFLSHAVVGYLKIWVADHQIVIKDVIVNRK